jgi:peptidyl-prolyl cis-trans isomerase B (cyclophilin B)
MKKIVFLIIALLVISGCVSSRTENYGQDSVKVFDSNEKNSESNDFKGEEMKYVTIETDKGIIKAELYAKDAPITTKNFMELADSGFYNGLTFHRIEPGFVAQGGDPKGDGTGGSPKMIPLEISSKLKHVKGALGMARSQDPNSARSQFYITLEASHFLDGNYAVFGKVVSGMDAAQELEVGDKMIKVTISDN